MSDLIRALILPALHAHFQRPEMRQKLRSLAAWDHSFEKWFQWEAVFALDEVWLRSFGSSLTEEQCEHWDIEVKRGGKRVDLVLPLPGGSDILLELKVYTPFFFFRKWVRGPNDCMARDIRWIHRIRKTTAATVVLVLETDRLRLNWHRNGLRPPLRHGLPAIELGTTWCAGVRKSCDVSARLYCWTNGIRAPTTAPATHLARNAAGAGTRRANTPC